MVKLSIVILSYNTKNLTLNCLKSILDRYKDSSSFEIIVVDNNSTDGSPQVVDNLKTKISNLKLIKNKANFGFSKGNNIGVKEAKGSYILFLNSDTEIKDLGFFDMVSFLESNPNIGILGGKLLNTDGSIQPSSGKFYNLFNVIITLLGGERLGFVRKTPEKIEQIDWVSGACMMVKKDIFLKLNGFDERLFMYMEDMEFCFRAKKIGFLTYFYPKVKLIHKELGSSNREFAILSIYKGLLYFYKKHKSGQFFIVKLLLVAKALVSIFIGFLTNSSYLKNTYRQGLKLAI